MGSLGTVLSSCWWGRLWVNCFPDCCFTWGLGVYGCALFVLFTGWFCDGFRFVGVFGVMELSV